MIALAAGLLVAGTIAAGEQAHTVAAGESAASLAKRYYGEADLGELLLRYNGKTRKVLHPGERLTIPFCEVYRARPGDTWSALAKRRLGRATASGVLAELNGYAAGEPLRVGTRVVFPVVLRHNLARGETLASVAERFYGDAKKAKTLQAFSRVGDANKLAVGTPLEIPLVVFLRAPAKPPEVVTVATPPPVEQRRFDGPLAAAARSFTDGDYDRAREMLEALQPRLMSEGTASDRRTWAELLAFVYVALDRDDEACTAYRSVPPPDGPASFDPDLVSPRIRTVLANCPA